MKTHRAFKLLAVSTLAIAAALPAWADEVFTNSVVIQNSLSIGLDATTGWNYGTDTLVMREGDLRIYFEDTSVTAGYPSNDWRIAINDIQSGGSSFFSIEDATAGRTPFKIMAGAPANGFHMASSGKLGLKTSSPQLDVHILSGDTPGLRLEQNNSSGWTPQTWDIGANEANFFVRDLTAGSRLPFRIRPGAPTSSLDVSASGFVGIGTDKPKAKLHVHVDAGQGLLIGNATSSGNTNLTGNAATLHVDGNALIASRLGIGSTNTVAASQALYVEGTAFVSQTLEIGSSRTRKENIRELSLSEAKAALKELNPVGFNYIGDNEDQLGFIAEDVPDAVATQSRKSLVPMDFVAVLTKVVQEHERRETELHETIASQQALLKDLADRLSAMEKRIDNKSTQE